jgi:hypothetical protein
MGSPTFAATMAVAAAELTGLVWNKYVSCVVDAEGNCLPASAIGARWALPRWMSWHAIAIR